MTSRETIAGWFDAGVAKGATHMLVLCDTFDWTDFPTYVMPDQNVQDVYERESKVEMQKVMEVYDLRLSKTMQMAERRAFHF